MPNLNVAIPEKMPIFQKKSKYSVKKSISHKKFRCSGNTVYNFQEKNADEPLKNADF